MTADSRHAGRGEPVDGLAAAIGGDIDPDLLDLAVTHRSFAYENGGVPTNERLEFLGDAVLGLVITEWLYREHPDFPEGQLAKLRSAVVNSRALAEVARTIGIGQFLKLGRGEERSGGRDKSSILADCLEAVIGAYYLSCGGEATRELVLRLFAGTIEAAAELGAGLDWKTSLQELASRRSLSGPEYTVVESGPDHAKAFRATVLLDDRPAGTGEGKSKKEAEQRAAEQAWLALSANGDAEVPPVPDDPAGADADRVVDA
ncbi:MAG TPA: ribonuclease III [Mycobacteriales bacterium]|nr:ribonuclease III [Mycobacteriales bacterium]